MAHPSYSADMSPMEYYLVRQLGLYCFNFWWLHTAYSKAMSTFSSRTYSFPDFSSNLTCFGLKTSMDLTTLAENVDFESSYGVLELATVPEVPHTHLVNKGDKE